MKTRKMYSSREEFEAKNPYVCVESSNYRGEKCAPAQIVANYSSKKTAENQRMGGRIMTRKQAEKFINRWNSELESGILSTKF